MEEREGEMRESTQMEEGGETFQSPWRVELVISLSRQVLISQKAQLFVV